jgi:hypothetical protein
VAPKLERLAPIFGMVATLFAKATTKLGLATTIAALWLTAVPITGAVADGVPISAARAAAIHECNLLAADSIEKCYTHNGTSPTIRSSPRNRPRERLLGIPGRGRRATPDKPALLAIHDVSRLNVAQARRVGSGLRTWMMGIGAEHDRLALSRPCATPLRSGITSCCRSVPAAWNERA